MRSQIIRASGLLALLAAGQISVGCGVSPDPPDAGLTRAEAYVERENASPVSSRSGDPPRVMSASGTMYSRADVWAALAEAAGGVVAEEIALGEALRARCRALNIVIGAEALTRERELVLSALDERVAPGRGADALLTDVRRVRGLGPERFRMLLERNAMLRALVADRVELTEAGIRQAYDLNYGPMHRGRVIVVNDASLAQRLKDDLVAGADFAGLASAHSVDASAARGGDIGAISVSDPAYPEGVRSALGGLKPGEIAGPVALPRGLALVQLVGLERTGGPSPARVRTESERFARLYQERLLMQSLARELLAEANPRFFDASMGWSWSQREAVRESVGD